MAKRMPKPFWKSQKRSWYVQIGNRQISLGPDEKFAQQRYHELMAGQEPIRPDAMLVPTVMDRFLEHVKANKSAATYTAYEYRLSGFYSFLSKKHPRGMKVADLKPLDVTNWLDSEGCAHYSSDTKNGFIRTIVRCFRWAKKQNLIQMNPLSEGMEAPGKSSREVTVSPEQWDLVMQHVTDEAFRDWLVAMKETGCRPFEVVTVCAKHVQRASRQWIFPRKDSKGKKYNRVVYLSDTAFAITQRLMLKFPTGPLFRNCKGEPWTKTAINSRLRRMKKHIGFKLMPYALRHTFATEALCRDVDSVVVGHLMGHRDPTMVAKTYGHVAGKHDFLRAKLHQALGQTSSASESASA